MYAEHSSTTTSNIVAKAEAMLASHFKRTRQPSTKVAAFQTENGRQLAIERNLRGITIWTERMEGTMSEKDDVEHYPPSRNRHSNLRAHAPFLYTGHSATKWRLPDLASVEDLMRWYTNA